MTAPNARPLFRLAGGKQRLAGTLFAYLPEGVDEMDYVEPFAGAASLFFRVQPQHGLLADLNGHLIRAYRHVRDEPDLVYRYVRDHERLDSVRHYYTVRDLYNRGRWNAAQAARFIYLNRTCFNGIFRVNRNGDFNVPYGRRPNPLFPTREDLIAASSVLRGTELRHQCFRKTLARTTTESFVYLDPPYPPLNGTAFFTHYTKDRFTEDDQLELAKVVNDLDRSGVPFMMSNADTPLIRRLYSRYDITPLTVTRFVTCKSTRHRVRELVIRNY